jgi:hypothetical protein
VYAAAGVRAPDDVRVGARRLHGNIVLGLTPLGSTADFSE